MKQLLKKSISFLFALAIILMLCLYALASESSSAETQVENMGIGGGGAFMLSLINPTDSTNYIATCDMGSLYRSNDRGISWDRTETRCAIRAACFAPDGTLFTGDYGLYVSNDNGQTLELIYPQNVVHSVSRMGTRENLFASQGYNNGLICCITVYDNQVYFATQDWNYELKLFCCSFDGSNLTELYSQQKYIEPTAARYGIVADSSGVYFSDGQGLYRINTSAKTAQRLYTAVGSLDSFTKIGSDYYVLEELGDHTKILYTSDFYSYRDLNDNNTLRNYFTWDETHYFQWHFKKIVGNNSDHIYLSFESDCTGLDYKLFGILTYNGTDFEWVYDTAFKHRSTLNLDHELGWTYNIYGYIYDINTDPNDDHRIIMANLETVYDIVYHNAQDYDIRTLHCTESSDNVFYTTSGLDVQDTHNAHQDPFDSQHIIIATTDMGMQLSYDGGNSWRRHNRNGCSMLENCYDIYFDNNTQGLVYGIWSSRNGGSKNPFTELLSPYSQGGFAVSYDGGINWDISYSTGLPSNSLPVSMSVVDNGDYLTIAVATCNNGFYISYDSGRTFTSISNGMNRSNGGIWGADVLIVDNTVYCLTAFHRISGATASELYTYDMTTGITTQIDLGDVVIGRSLTYDETQGLFLSVVSYYRYQWLPGDIDTSVNYGGGIYKIENNSISMVYSETDGIHNCAFTPDGTMYATGVYGKLYIAQDDQLVEYQSNLFEALKTITFSNDYSKMYISTDGGGTYCIDTLYQPEEPDVPQPPVEPGCTHIEEIRDERVATCTEAGYTGDTYCSVCCELLTSGTEIPKLPHIEEIRNVRAATSTEPGYTGDTYCSECNELLITGTVIPISAHIEEIRNSRAATCTEAGYTGDVYCSDCGELLKYGSYTSKLPHTEELRNFISATCSVIGFTGDVYCSVCDEYISSGTYIPKLPHTEEIRDARAATSTEPGYTGDTYCSECNMLLRTGTVIPITTHIERIRSARAATCTEPGYTGDVYCADCGEVLRRGTEIPIVPHTEEIRSARNATCTSTGYTGDTYCSMCDNMLMRGSSIPKIPHSEVIMNERNATCTSIGYTGDTVCTICGEISNFGTYLPTLSHTEKIVINSDNTHSVICDVCGYLISTDTCVNNNGDDLCDICRGELSQNNIFAPETFNVSLSKTLTRRNNPVIMTVKTSEDVVSININGVKVQDYRTTSQTYTIGSGRNKVKVTEKYHVFTYTIKEANKGTYRYDVIAYNSIGKQSSPETAVLQVK